MLHSDWLLWHAASPCTSPNVVTFSGARYATVGTVGVFNLSAWGFDSQEGSSAGSYPQAIDDESTSAPINVTAPNGVTLCALAVCAYDTDFATANFTGTTVGGAAPTPVIAPVTLPTWPGAVNVTFDATWTGITSVNITSGGGDSSVELWAIYYV